MLYLLIQEIIKPMCRRFGTLSAGAIAAFGVSGDQLIQVETAITALALVLCDLGLSYLDRTKK